MKPSDRRRLELVDAIAEATIAVEEAEASLTTKLDEVRQARKDLAEKRTRLADLNRESAHGTPDLPIVAQIAANQDARGEITAMPASTPEAAFRRCLNHALVGRDGPSALAWSKRPSFMTDAEIVRLLHETWPAGETWVSATEVGGKYGYTIQTSPTPAIWIGGKAAPRSMPTASHSSLVRVVRDLFAIGEREETVDERLDAALLHVLTRPPFGDQYMARQLEGMTDSEILTELTAIWPIDPEHLRFADDDQGEGFTVCGGDGLGGPELQLGGPLADVGLDSARMLRGDRLVERVREVLGLAEVIDTMAAASKPSKPRKSRAKAKAKDVTE